MTPIPIQERVEPPTTEPLPIDAAAHFSEEIAAVLAEGTLYLRLDPAAVWLVD